MLLDANGLIYRAYFALFNTPLTTSRGELVNAVFGFWSIVLRGFQDVRPDYVMACFDLAAPTFRHEAFAEYKATRQKMPDDLRDQFPKVRELIEAFRIPIHQLEGWEADDLIGTLSRQAEGRGLQTTIVSGDLDMLQLVSERTSVMTTRGGVQQTVVYDPAAVFERYGLTPAQMIDFKALKGDTTDNIPGIPGVGDKTAAKLLQDFGSLDAMYAEVDRVTPEKLRQKVVEHHDQVLANRELVTIHRDLPVELDLSAAGLGHFDRAEVIRLFREYEFRSLVERLPTLDGDGPLVHAHAGRHRPRPCPRRATPRPRRGGERAAADARLRRPGRLRDGAGDARSGAALRGGRDARCRAAGRPARPPPRAAARPVAGGARRRGGRPRGLAGSPALAGGGARARRSPAATGHAARPRRGRRGRAPAGRERRRGNAAPGRDRRRRSSAGRPRGEAPPRRRAGPPRPGRLTRAGPPRRGSAAGRLRHADRRLPAQRRPAQPDAHRHLRRAVGRRAARGRHPGWRRPRGGRGCGGRRGAGLARAGVGRGGPGAPLCGAGAAAHPGPGGHGGDRRGHRPRGAGRAQRRVLDRDRAPGGRP